MLGDWSRRPVARAIVVAVLAFSVFAGSIPAGYVFDDTAAILRNPVVTGKVSAAHAFKTDFFGTMPPAMGVLRPLVTLSYRQEFGAPVVSHALNVAWFMLVVALTYLVGRTLLSEAAAFGGALLLSTLAAPAEAVQALVGRADLMLAALALGGLWLHRQVGFASALGATLCFGAAGLCKESAAFVPIAWVALDVVRRTGTLRAGRLLAYFAMALLLVGVRLHALGGALLPVRFPALEAPLGHAATGPRVFGAGHVLIEQYLAGVIDPFRRLYMCSAPQCAPSDASDPVAWVGLALALALVGTCVWALRRGHDAGVGLGWALLFFLPVSNLVVPSTTSYAERLLLLPAIGGAWAVAACAHTLSSRGHRFAWAMVASVAAINAIAVLQRNLDWRDNDALFSSALDVGARSAVIQLNAATTAYRRRDATEAERLARRALELHHPYPMASSVLASSLDRLDRPADAEAEFNRAIEGSRRDPAIVADYGRFLIRRRRLTEAMAVLKSSLAQHPHDPDTLMLLDQLRSLGADPRP